MSGITLLVLVGRHGVGQDQLAVGREDLFGQEPGGAGLHGAGLHDRARLSREPGATVLLAISSQKRGRVFG
jgi:hypothetical protein